MEYGSSGEMAKAERRKQEPNRRTGSKKQAKENQETGGTSSDTEETGQEAKTTGLITGVGPNGTPGQNRNSGRTEGGLLKGNVFGAKTLVVHRSGQEAEGVMEILDGPKGEGALTLWRQNRTEPLTGDRG